MSGASVLSGCERAVGSVPRCQYETTWTNLGLVEEGVREELGGAGPLVGVDLEALLEEVAEDDRELLGVVDRRAAVRRDEVQRSQRVLVEVRRLAFDHFWMGGPSVSGGGARQTGDAPMAMMPRDQTSTFGPYSLRVTTSGAIQYGVPTMVVRFAFSPWI